MTLGDVTSKASRVSPQTYGYATTLTSSTARRLAVVIVLRFTGCTAPVSMQPVGPIAQFGHDAALIYVPGIGGRGSSDAAWIRGLRTGGYEGKAEIFDWTGPLEPVQALWAHGRHRQQAQHIADRIRSLRAEAPRAPIILAGHGAGAGLVILALEDLPPSTRVDGIVLLAPALSRTYDLTAALRRVHGHVDVFCSDRDTLVLGVGTFLFGTVDGVHGEAAGQSGFIRPSRAPAEQYGKLRTHHFSRARQLLGDDGSHFGCLNSNLAAALVTPLLPRSQMPTANPFLVRATRDAGSPIVRHTRVRKRLWRRVRRGESFYCGNSSAPHLRLDVKLR
jgi:pimeloyl-ACP methyl ester carboxylesterase